MAAPTAIVPVLDLRPGGPEEHAARWLELCRRTTGLSGPADEAARAIVADVAKRGDRAVDEYRARFDGLDDDEPFEIPMVQAQAALASLDPAVRDALTLAAQRVQRFHETQLPPTTGLDRQGERLRSRATPLQRVAVYAPGGTAAYPSSVLMTAIVAKVAGVPEIFLLTPRASPVVLAAAALAGVTRIFAVGGAQAIAAAAFGSERLPKVDKIVGPGNAYVTAAKRMVFGVCDIDSIAGPSEILVLADASADPEIIAADLLSQAEHDEQAGPIVVTDHASHVPAIQRALSQQLADLPRREIAETSLRTCGALVLVDDREAMIEQTNLYAPEHLEVLADQPRELAQRLRTAGAIFVGGHTPEAAGDYTAGPSHVLPTAGAARFASPLGVWDFIKYTSVLELSAQSLEAQATAITTLARAEGLEAHARAVEIRLAKAKTKTTESEQS